MMLRMEHADDISRGLPRAASSGVGGARDAERTSGGEEPNIADDEFRRSLEAFLSQAAQATTWHVVRPLKRSDFETTELVEGCPSDHPAGRFIRKRIDAVSGAGAAYLSLWKAQQEGSCPLCVPHLVELGVIGDELSVVMEYVEGCTVSALVTSLGAGPQMAAMVMPGLCDAVADIHEAFDPPLIHRDLKPSNVLMRSGLPVIIDFGSARQWREDAESDTTHFLTRRYAPPEQFGFGQTDARSDVYALGKMLYFCLTGSEPPNLCDAAACERAGISPALAEVICRSCAFDPDSRYGGARVLGSEIRRALAPDGVDVSAHATPVVRDAFAGRIGQFARRWVPAFWNVSVALVYALLVAGSIGAIVNPNERDALLPLWFRIAEYVGIGMVSSGSVAFLLIGKRRLRGRVPGWASVPRKIEVLWAAAAFVIGIAVPLFLGMAAGVL